MTKTVSSRFSFTFWLKAILKTLILFGSIAGCVKVAIERSAGYSRAELLLTACFCMILIAMYLYLSIGALKQFTAAPEGIIIYYYLTNKRVIIDYADITHIDNILVTVEEKTNTTSEYLKLVIEFNTGGELVIYKDDMTNYDELKEAIRQFRFHLNT
jgi:hypothetical protein